VEKKTDATFPDGMYSYGDLNSYLQKEVGRVNPNDDKSK